MEEALLIRGRVRVGAIGLGAFLGLAFAVTIIGLSVRRKRDEYQPDKAACFSCGRCIEACVMERVRRAESAPKVQKTQEVEA